MDSNHRRRFQRPACYRYTNPEYMSGVLTTTLPSPTHLSTRLEQKGFEPPFPDSVLHVGFEPTSSVLQTEAITRFANGACLRTISVRVVIIKYSVVTSPIRVNTVGVLRVELRLL